MKDFRKTVTDIDEERYGNYTEDHFDHVYLEALVPETHISTTRKGLVRMGSQIDPSLIGEMSFPPQQYSKESGYVPDRLLHGRKLSTVLEESKAVDPEKNIMEHIHGRQA